MDTGEEGRLQVGEISKGGGTGDEPAKTLPARALQMERGCSVPPTAEAKVGNEGAWGGASEASALPGAGHALGGQGGAGVGRGTS